MLFCGQLVSLLGDGMVSVALAFAVIGLRGSASQIGLVFTARSVALVACLLAGGVVADQVGRRTVMVAADLVRLGSQGALAVLLLAGSPAVSLLAALAGVTGAATGFFYPASTGLLPTVVAPEELQPANALRGLSMSAGRIGGPIAAGVLVAGVGAGWALAVDAATFAVSAACVAGLRLPPRVAPADGRFVADLREGWREFRSRTWLWSFVLCAAFGNLVYGSWNVVGPVVAQRDLGGAAVWGAIIAVSGVGGLAGGVLALHVRPRRPLLAATLSLLVFFAPLALLAAGLPALLVAAGAFVADAGLVLSNTVWESTMQRHVAPEALSRVSAYDWFGSMALQPVGLALWGPIAALIGDAGALWLAFALGTGSVLTLLTVRDIRELPSNPASPRSRAPGATPHVAEAD